MDGSTAFINIRSKAILGIKEILDKFDVFFLLPLRHMGRNICRSRNRVPLLERK